MQTPRLNVPPPTILIVDDQIDNIQVLAVLLESHGYSITYALNGKDALQRLTVMQPDIILLDLFMPGINGLEVCEQIKSNLEYQDIPILFLSASHDKEHLIAAFEKGASDYVMKPFQSKEVLVRIETHIKLRQQTREIQLVKEKLETIVTHVQDGLLVIDRDGVIQFVNPAATHMFNKPPSDLLGNQLGIPIVRDTITQIEILRLNGEFGTAEITVADADWAGAPASIICLRDISDRRHESSP